MTPAREIVKAIGSVLLRIAMAALASCCTLRATDVTARDDPETCLRVAEELKQAAEQNRLTPEQLARAASLLNEADPFTRALAEWAIATKVGRDNNGYEVAWPGENPPAWYRAWTAVPRETLIELDWARQAVALGIHRDAKQLMESVEVMVQRAEAVVGADAAGHAHKSLDALREVRRKLGARRGLSPKDPAAERALWIEARRALRPIVLAAVAADCPQIVILTYYAEHTNPNITGSQVAWKHKPSGDVCVLSDLWDKASVRPVIGGRLGPGHVDSFDLHWNADRIVVAHARQKNWPPKTRIDRGPAFYRAHEFRAAEEPIHLYEVRLDSPGLRQLTDDPYWSDTEPTYTPEGDIVFSSDRCGQGVECGYATHPSGGASELSNCNLYRISADGQGLRRLTNQKDIDRYPHCLDNGLIAYTRWEYQERHFWDVHSVWTVRPDGTMSDALFKQHLGDPISLRHARSVPGGGKLVAIASGHHTFAYGPVVLIDPKTGINSDAAIRLLTPGCEPQEAGSPVWRGPKAWRTPVSGGGVPSPGGFFQTPFALSETRFLVAYAYASPNTTSWGGADSNAFAIYLIDVYGDKELVYRDPLLSCVSPIPVRKRTAPPTLPETTDQTKDYATCYLANVNEGLDGVGRGTVKYVRISQELPWPLDPRSGSHAYAWGTMWGPHAVGVSRWSSVRVIGTVPVEADGSAYFNVPTVERASLYFQALDENFMELRRMRSSVSFQPGELRGCNGCHESRASAAQANLKWSVALAARQPPRFPDPPPWKTAMPLDYKTLIQPILDRHCLKCHNDQDGKGGWNLAGTPVPGSESTYLFPATEDYCGSYLSILGFKHWSDARACSEVTGPEPLVSLSDRFSDGGVTAPFQFGSHRSRLATLVLKEHEGVRLTQSEWLTLVTWIDANAPYHGRLINQRPAAGGPPRREWYPWPDPWSK